MQGVTVKGRGTEQLYIYINNRILELIVFYEMQYIVCQTRLRTVSVFS
jgi:hypothetical protein